MGAECASAVPVRFMSEDAWGTLYPGSGAGDTSVWSNVAVT